MFHCNRQDSALNYHSKSTALFFWILIITPPLEPNDFTFAHFTISDEDK